MTTALPNKRINPTVGAPSHASWWSFIRCAPPAGYAERYATPTTLT